MANQVSKLTISVPTNLLSVADKIAKKKKVSRSKLVTLCLQQLAQQYLESEMIEGYKVMAAEQKALAALAIEKQSEIVPEWQ